MKNFLIALGISLFLAPALALAVNISVPSSPGAGFWLPSTTTGAYISSSTNPLYIGSLFASTSLTSTFNGQISDFGTLAAGSELTLGSSTPFSDLTVVAQNGDTNTSLFIISSSTLTTTTTLFQINNLGAITQGGGASSTFSNGINFTAGCITYNGSACITTGTGSTASDPFTHTSVYGQTTSATSTLLALTGSPFSLVASSTVNFVNATTTGNQSVLGYLTVGTGTPISTDKLEVYGILSVDRTDTGASVFTIQGTSNGSIFNTQNSNGNQVYQISATEVMRLRNSGMDVGNNGGTVPPTNGIYVQGSANSGITIATTTSYWPLTIADATLPQIALTDTTSGNNAWTLRSIANSFYLATSTATATSTTPAFDILSNLNAGFATASPGTLFSIGNIANFTLATSSLYGTGVDLASGCFSVAGTCLQTTISSASAFKQAVTYASTTTLPANSYSNGTGGVGATITGTANGPFYLDGNTPAVGSRVLVKNEGTGANNGIYTLTTLGVAGVSPFVLTRATDYNSSADVFPGVASFVNSGTVNANTCWILTNTTAVTIGTTALTYDDACGAGSFTGTAPITITGTTVALTTPLSILFGGTGTTTAPVSQLLYGGSGSVYQSVGTSSFATSAGFSYSGTLGSLVGGTNGTLSTVLTKSFTYSTSTAWTGTTTIPLEEGILLYTFNGVRCKTISGGTLNFQLGNGTASTTMYNASSTNNFNTYSSNNIIAAGDTWQIDIGTPATSPTKINCTLKLTL